MTSQVARSWTAQPPGSRPQASRVATHGQQVASLVFFLPLCRGAVSIFYSPSRQGDEKNEPFYIIVTNLNETSMAKTHKRCNYFPHFWEFFFFFFFRKLWLFATFKGTLIIIKENNLYVCLIHWSFIKICGNNKKMSFFFQYCRSSWKLFIFKRSVYKKTPKNPLPPKKKKKKKKKKLLKKLNKKCKYECTMHDSLGIK